MHDSVDLERRGVPTVFVASDVFVDAANVQGEALGFQPERVFVKHPIQDRTDDEMVALADEAVDALVRSISEPEVPVDPIVRPPASDGA